MRRSTTFTATTPFSSVVSTKFFSSSTSSLLQQQMVRKSFVSCLLRSSSLTPSSLPTIAATASVLSSSNNFQTKRWCSTSTGNSSNAVAMSPSAENEAIAAQQQAPGLADLKDVSDGDKELLRQAFFEPEKIQSYAKQPLGDANSGGAGNKKGDMAAVFTCNVCKHRSVKRFTKHSYTKGVVIVQCGGCGNKHLLADHLGWFEDNLNTIEDILKAKGEEVKRLNVSIHIDSPQEVSLDAAEAALAAFENKKS